MKTITLKSGKEIELNQAFNMDCLDFMKELPDKCIDLVLTDPPYPVISGGSVKNYGILSKNDGKIFKHNDIKIIKWLPEIYRILKDDTHCYIMTNTINLTEMLNETKALGFKLHNLLVWEKQNSTPNRWYLKNCEYILFLRKGKAKPINFLGSNTVHKFINKLGNKTHPTQKNIEHMNFLLTNSTSENDIVFDPFLGSFSVASACNMDNRNWLGCEKDPDYFKAGYHRYEQETKQLLMEF